jgi:hypothetical protein
VIHPCGPSTDRSRARLTARRGSQQGWPSRRGWSALVADVDDAPVHCSGQSKVDRARDVSLVNEAERPRRVPLEPRGQPGYGCQMSVPIAVDKAETENAPIESAIAKFVLRSDLACGIRELRIGRVILEAGMGCVRIVDQSGACHDEANLWSVCFRSGDQVFCAIEISPPDVILILSPENRGKMNDRRSALHGLLQPISIEKVAFHENLVVEFSGQNLVVKI